MKIGLFLLILVALVIVGRLVLLSVLSNPPETLGLHDGRLAPCPQKPNCVSSQAKGKSHGIEPLRVVGSPERALADAQQAIASLPGARVVTVAGHYLHAEFRSRLFRFVDDLELLYDEELPGFQVRSASRVGNSDLGVNRKRVEALRQLFSSPR